MLVTAISHQRRVLFLLYCPSVIEEALITMLDKNHLKHMKLSLESNVRILINYIVKL